MGGEYDHKIPRRIFRDGSQNARSLESPCLRLRCQEKDQREGEEI